MFGSRRSSDTGRSTGFMASAALVGLVALGLVVVLVYALVSRHSTPAAPTAAGSGSPSTPVAGATPSTQPASSTDGDRPAGCATTGTNQKVPLDPIPVTKWTLVDGFAVPSTKGDGPMLRDAVGIGYCYSHTPDGAVLAASNFGHGVGSAQAIVDAILSHVVVPGPLASQVAATPATPVGGGGGGIQLSGFRVISYNPTTTSIALALHSTGSAGTYSTVTLVLQWSAGDWRVVTQPGPSFFLNPSTASSLAGFVVWSGVS